MCLRSVSKRIDFASSTSYARPRRWGPSRARRAVALVEEADGEVGLAVQQQVRAAVGPRADAEGACHEHSSSRSFAQGDLDVVQERVVRAPGPDGGRQADPRRHPDPHPASNRSLRAARDGVPRVRCRPENRDLRLLPRGGVRALDQHLDLAACQVRRQHQPVDGDRRQLLQPHRLPDFHDCGVYQMPPRRVRCLPRESQELSVTSRTATVRVCDLRSPSTSVMSIVNGR